ncbi:hypothetical protein H5410_046280 [Solanum commersonii]|uniref:Uncharacterized protein n=1 Tax=Solanum commersonii TaxID=4109 RepID=A0A9J5XF79_SOLCO|nr:hypothetical protein H5410_046280 [Solanum commersonii]
MHIAISGTELDGLQKIISPNREKMFHSKLFRGNDCTNQGLQHTKKLSDSIVPFERSDEANSRNFTKKLPDLRLQIRPSSHQFHDDLTTGVYSPGEEVHLIAISSKMDGPIVGDMNFGEGDATRGNYSRDEEVHFTNLSINIAQEHSQEEIQVRLITSKINQHIELEELHGRTEAEQQGTYSQDYTGPNDQNDQHENPKPTTLEVIEVESSSHFSFGIKPMDTMPNNGGHQGSGKAVNYINEANHDKLQEQQAINNNSQSKSQGGEGSQAGKSPHSKTRSDAVSLSSSDDHVNINAKGKTTVILNNQKQDRGDNTFHQQVDRNQSRGNNNGQPQLPNQGGESEYHKEFPKISSNFDRPTNSIQKVQQTFHPNQSQNHTNPNENPKTKQDQNTEPAPYTMVQTLAAKLRQIHATHATSMELVPTRHTTKQG